MMNLTYGFAFQTTIGPEELFSRLNALDSWTWDIRRDRGSDRPVLVSNIDVKQVGLTIRPISRDEYARSFGTKSVLSSQPLGQGGFPSTVHEARDWNHEGTFFAVTVWFQSKSVDDHAAAKLDEVHQHLVTRLFQATGAFDLLGAMISTLPIHRSPPGWQEKVWTRIEKSKSRFEWKRWRNWRRWFQ